MGKEIIDLYCDLFVDTPKNHTGREIAFLHGFNYYMDFVDWLLNHHPDCVKELKKTGWRQDTSRYLTSHWVTIIHEHLGQPRFRKTFKTQLALIYGFSSFWSFKQRMEELSGLMDTLYAYGYTDTKKSFIPYWIEIIIDYMGVPAKIEEITLINKQQYEELLSKHG